MSDQYGYDRTNEYRVEFRVFPREGVGGTKWEWSRAFGRTAEEAREWFKTMLCKMREYFIDGDKKQLDYERVDIIAMNKVH